MLGGALLQRFFDPLDGFKREWSAFRDRYPTTYRSAWRIGEEIGISDSFSPEEAIVNLNRASASLLKTEAMPLRRRLRRGLAYLILSLDNLIRFNPRSFRRKIARGAIVNQGQNAISHITRQMLNLRDLLFKVEPNAQDFVEYEGHLEVDEKDFIDLDFAQNLRRIRKVLEACSDMIVNNLFFLSPFRIREQAYKQGVSGRAKDILPMHTDSDKFNKQIAALRRRFLERIREALPNSNLRVELLHQIVDRLEIMPCVIASERRYGPLLAARAAARDRLARIGRGDECSTELLTRNLRASLEIYEAMIENQEAIRALLQPHLRAHNL